jgi:hypothetical protein
VPVTDEAARCATLIRPTLATCSATKGRVRSTAAVSLAWLAMLGCASDDDPEQIGSTG